MRLPLALLLLGVGSSLAAVFQDISQIPFRTYDFIVIGGGTSGLVVANRLTEDPKVRVLVIEAGPSHQGNINLQVPWLAGRLLVNGDALDWNTTSIPQPSLNGRSVLYSRARVLGGSTSHNGMTWARGSSDDYDRWAKVSGDKGWSWKEMLPFLKKTEHWTKAPGHGPEEGNFDPQAHGFRGPLKVGLSNVRQETDPLVLQTTQDLPDEFPFTEDYNAGRCIGNAWTQFSIANGTRSSAATSFLDPIVDRPNLSVLIETYVTRVLQTSKGSFRTVEFAHNQTSPLHRLTASKEVILAAGVIGTPQVLMNSGIGDSAELKKVGVEPIVHLPSVGKNFTTQPFVLPSWRANAKTVNLNTNMTAFNEALQQWITSRTGRMTGGDTSMTAYVRLPRDSPVLAGHVDPSAGPNTPHFFVFANANGYFSSITIPAVSVVTILSEPASRGSVALKSKDPFELPLVDLAFYSAPVDMAIFIEAFKSAQRYVNGPAWKGFTLDRITPPPSVVSDQEIEEFIRNSTTATYHGIGTASISPRGAAYGVVNPDLLVKGTSGLRIVDASIIPFSPASATQSPIYAVGERGSDLIKRAWKLK